MSDTDKKPPFRAPFHQPTWAVMQLPRDERPKYDLEEVMKGRPRKPIHPRIIFKIGEAANPATHAEAKALMKMLRPKFRTKIKEFDSEQLIKIDIPMELFQCLLKWIHIHGREGRWVVTRQLRKLDMKNLASYTKIYLQGDGIVEKSVLNNIIEYVKGLVIRASVSELSEFPELANSAHFKSEDNKFEVLKEALVMKGYAEVP